uniref:Huntingtin n=1 Tax=Syphacia muris TaxID=451379 RepID=A0A158R5J8_9BILA
MERLTSALNVLQRSKKSYETAPLDKKNLNWEKEKNAFVNVKEVLVQKGVQKDPRFSEHFSRAVDLLFYFINHRNPDVRLIAEQSLSCIFRHMVAESNSSRVVVFLLMELKRNGGARSLIVAFNLLAEVIDSVKPNKTGVIGAHIVGALCAIARRPEDSVQNCLEKILPKIFFVFSRQFTAHRSEDSSSLYEIALENLELTGSTSRAASVLIHQLSLYFPDILDKSFKQLGNYLFRKEKKNLVVGALNTLKLIWPSVMFQKDNFSCFQFQKIIYDTLVCLFSCHNEVVVASLEFLEAILSTSLLFIESLPFSSADGPSNIENSQDNNSPIKKSSVQEELSEQSVDTTGNSSCCPSVCKTNLSVESDEKQSHLFDYSDDGSSEIKEDNALLSSDEEEILDPLRHDSLSFNQDKSSDSFALYTAVLITRRFLLSDHCLRQIPDSDVRVSHKILAMNCLSHLANCLPNFFNISLQKPERLGTPLLKDIQLFINHEDDLLKAATVATIINATRAALWSSQTTFIDTATFVRKCICEVMRIRRAHCSRSLFFCAKSAGDVVSKLQLTDELFRFACESAKDNYFLLRVSVAEYLSSIQWKKSGSCFQFLPDIVFETYMKLLADGDSKVSKAAALNLPLLVANANYAECVTSDGISLPKSFLCSSFDFNALTVAMGSEYNFFELPNNTYSINLSIVLYKMFAYIETGADELMQAGIISALASLVVDYPPSVYPTSWGIVGYNDQSRIGLLTALLSQCCVVPLSLTTIGNIFQIVSFLVAGICKEQAIKIDSRDDGCAKTAIAKFFDSKLIELLLLSPLRVLNLYYTIVTEHEQDITTPKSAILSPNISPVRKVLHPAPSAFATEHRIQSITNLVGSGVKPIKTTSFLHSPALSNVADSLRGMYSNYMEGLSPDIRSKFSELLVSALSNLSCILEMVAFSHISPLLKEVLLYCRVMMDLAATETVKLVIQLLKVLFGTNGCHLNINEVKKMIPIRKALSEDCFESLVLQHINNYAEFVVDSGSKESAGWIRRDIISKSQLTPEETVEATIGFFENFVSKAIRLFYVSNSYNFQTSTLHLLCELIAGGIKFSMLDPKMQLFNFLCTYINEFGSRNWFNSKTINTEEVVLVRAVFHFFALMSKMEGDSKTMLEPKKTVTFCEVMVNAAIAKPQLARCALNSLQVILLELVAVRKRFEQSIEKILFAAEPLGKVCPTEYIELWSLYLHSVGCYGDEQRKSKVSLLFFDVFQNLKDRWDFNTAFSSMIALRLCSSATFRPIDTFLKNLVQILQSKKYGSFERLMYCSPYLFILFCVMDDNCILSRFEMATDMTFEEFSKLLNTLLMDCVSDLKNLSFPMALCHGAEYCRLLIWLFQILSYAVRSGGLKSITSTLDVRADCIIRFDEVFDCYPQLLVPFLSFYCSLQQFDFHLFSHGLIKKFSLLCKLKDSKSSCVQAIVELKQLLKCCSSKEFKALISALKPIVSTKFCMEERSSFCNGCMDLLKESTSVTSAFDVLDLMTLNELYECDELKSLTVLRMESYAFDFFLRKITPVNDFKNAIISDSNISELSDMRSSEDVEAKNKSLSYLSILEPKTFHRDALSSLIVSLLKEPGKIISAQCVSGNFSLFDAKCGEEVLRCAYNCDRFDVINACMEEITLISTAAFNCGDMYSEYSVLSVQKAEAVCKICVDLAFEPALNLPLQLCAQSKFLKDSYKSFLKPASEWANDEERFNWWFDKYIETISVDEQEVFFMDPIVFNAITFSISQPSFINAIEGSELKAMIEKQLILGKCLAKILKVYMGSSEMKKVSDVNGKQQLNWDIVTHDRSGRKNTDLDFFSESIQTAFELAMTIQDAFRKRNVNGYLKAALEKLAKAITRLPLFNDVACIPRMALFCKWRVELEIRNNAVAVSTVNIHHLCNVDVLRDFIWRLCWAGWSRNINFNNFSMSLFGVLSSTPTGSELISANMNITEQLMASTAAVEGLTNMLLQTTLFPERGNPIFGTFLTKPREMSTDFILTQFGQRLCMLKVRLSDSPEISETFQKNIEFTEKTNRYNPGQLSVHAMWNMSGVLDLERNLFGSNVLSSPKKISNSDSIYLLQSGHDSTNESCLRMLFDIYSHWFRMGVDAVPLPLLSAVIRSMLLLSDLFVELDQFEFVFTHMKSLFNVRSHVESADLGNIICCLLKCIAVLGLEGISLLKADALKLILNCVECGLSSASSDLRVRTLQGLLYILQSLSHEDLRAVLLYVQSFLLNELSVRSPGMDPVNMDIEFESCEYETYLWSTALFLCENFLYSSEDFKATLLDFLHKTFISPLSPNWLMNLLTCGAERLVVSSRAYINHFNRMAIQAMKNYFIIPKKFVFALRISMACLYHGMHEARMHRVGLEPYDSELYLMEQFPAIFKILAEGNENDATLLMRVLPHLLIDSLNQSEIINNVLKELIHRYPHQCHPRPKAIFVVVHHWFGVLRSRETEAVVIEWTLNGLDSFRYISNAALYRFYVNAFICSSSANPYVASLFHVVVNRSASAQWLDDLWFPFIIRSLLSRLSEGTAKELKKKMETYILNGVEHKDPSRVRCFPVL